ncbi:myo-inositol 2-dehydrogenase/D-chiro-inositol 1-dehydrogenase [Kineococcus xinjiangensis]|uniref:Inositol 2-dehydrogenase n=1 Tax=Kineococcus xinjiangensis TaxID=512762 RepID=A0A2S6IUB8_9ACTN|nr:Gfo/Idh/MocA family oxidoreductase [Kineococcus xinjiangensis]PPK97870.1 myo-inositol 2-dehydrogenase/D-chiro-inositol 1-dehydrogenase [Kineococcus xinjiangensis]
MSTATTTATATATAAASRGGDLRVAVLGVGVMGQDHARRLSTRTAGARLVAVSDVDAARTRAVADEFGVRAVHDPFAAITDPDVDAVVIATPGFAHEEQVLACLEHGVPVLCEKPLTTSAETSLRIVRAERELGQQLVQVGFMRRFDAEYQQLRALVASGELGRPLFLHCIHRNASIPPHFTSEMLVLDSVVHEVDAARYLLGEEITAVTVLRPRASSEAPEGLQDPQFVLLETAGGALVDVEVFVNARYGYEVRTELVAERGTAQIGLGVDLVRRSAAGWGGSIPRDFRERFGAAYDTEVQRWVDAVRRGTVDGPSAWDGYAAAAVCAAGVESLRTGRRVEVDLS